VETTEAGTRPALDELVDHILTLDRKMDQLYDQGKRPGHPEWQRCDELLTEIGEELNTEGGVDRMHAALDRAHTYGLRGHYVERHWNGIGAWLE
jgi:hypothetical protein